jgi:hypothetical protein
MNDPKRLAVVIKEMHGCQARHVRSEPVTERFRGETVWDGVVEVFDAINCPSASTVYAWTYEADDGSTRHLAVLGVPPINSAVDAVRAAVVAQVRASSSE